MAKNTWLMLSMMSVATLITACSTAPTTGQQNYGVPVMNRTMTEHLADEGIERTVLKNLTNVEGVSQLPPYGLRVVVNSFRREVLLTGEVPSQKMSQDIEAMVKSMKDVTEVFNYMTVSTTPRTQSHTLHEQFLKSKIIAKVLKDRFIRSSQYKVVVRNDNVYLMGYATPEQEEQMLKVLGDNIGIQQVYLLWVLQRDGNTPTPTGGYEQPVGAPESIYTGGEPYTQPPSSETGYGNDSYNPNIQNPNTVAIYDPNAQDPYAPTPTTNGSYNPMGNYGGQVTPSGMPSPMTTPVIESQGQPTTGYVQLYNGTDSP